MAHTTSSTTVAAFTATTHYSERLRQAVCRWGLRLTVVGGMLWSSPAAFAEDAAAPVEPASIADALDEELGPAFSEDSVLVATRKLDAVASGAAVQALEPIARPAERQPELAEPKPTLAPAPEDQSSATVVPTPAAADAAAPTPITPTPVTPKPIAQLLDAAKSVALNATTEPGAEKASVAASKPALAAEAKPAAEANPAEEVVAKVNNAPVAAPVEKKSVEKEVVKQEPVVAQVEPTKPAAPLRVASRTPAAEDVADVAKAYAQATKIEPARFHGIVPGVSTDAQLVAAWGPAKETSPTESGKVYLYEMAPFAAVDVLIENEIVSLIKVELDNQQQPERLARRLRLDKVRSVEILDESGRAVLGLAYPEKGMLLLLARPASTIAPVAPQFVTHMVIQPLDAEAFALRADQTPDSAIEKKLADLHQAIDIDPESAYANWQLAELYRLTASPDKAEPAAKAALKAEPENDAYRLCWAQCLADQGKYDDAVLEARKVLDSKSAPSVVKAGALHLMGRLASMGDSKIAEKAIGFHTMAIDIADKLTTAEDRRERSTAKRLLVDAHLAIAREIARRKYARKQEIVAQWIGRASGLAEEMIATGDGGVELRLIVACESLAALADLKPTKDPSPWIKEAEDASRELLAAKPDHLFRSRMEWQLGQAYFHALRVEHNRKEADRGIRYGKLAIRHLASGATVGDVRPEAESLVGRLYFHLGAIYAVHKQDHKQAVKWYEQARPLLTSDTPASELAVPRRKGEALVSMAVSYWEQGQRAEAVQLTVAGSELMEQAVAGGVLDEQSLAVPYGNLATMHSKLGDRTASAKFAKLARGARGSATGASQFADAVNKANAAQTRQASRTQSQTPPRRAAANPATRPNPSASRTSSPAPSRQRAAARPAARTAQKSASSPTASQTQRNDQARSASSGHASNVTSQPSGLPKRTSRRTILR